MPCDLTSPRSVASRPRKQATNRQHHSTHGRRRSTAAAGYPASSEYQHLRQGKGSPSSKNVQPDTSSFIAKRLRTYRTAKQRAWNVSAPQMSSGRLLIPSTKAVHKPFSASCRGSPIEMTIGRCSPLGSFATSVVLAMASNISCGITSPRSVASRPRGGADGSKEIRTRGRRSSTAAAG